MSLCEKWHSPRNAISYPAISRSNSRGKQRTRKKGKRDNKSAEQERGAREARMRGFAVITNFIITVISALRGSFRDSPFNACGLLERLFACGTRCMYATHERVSARWARSIIQRTNGLSSCSLCTALSRPTISDQHPCQHAWLPRTSSSFMFLAATRDSACTSLPKHKGFSERTVRKHYLHLDGYHIHVASISCDLILIYLLVYLLKIVYIHTCICIIIYINQKLFFILI